MIAFGPVPSRRLGRSLGINNIPYKVCTYSCLYCQVGRTRRLQTVRRHYHDPAEIAREVEGKLRTIDPSGDRVDFLTFVPDGEPTLDLDLGTTIDLLRSSGIRIAVISNGSLCWHHDVRRVLEKADWVSLKVDAATVETWRRINRPHGALQLGAILDGILEFRQSYGGILVTETMLVQGINDTERDLVSTAEYLGRLQPEKSFLSIPIRPPAETWVLSPAEPILAGAFEIFSRHVAQVEHLIGYEGSAFACTGDPEQDLLSITAVHPMREEAVARFLRKAKADWSTVRRLISRGLMVATDYNGKRFYSRSFSTAHNGHHETGSHPDSAGDMESHK